MTTFTVPRTGFMQLPRGVLGVAALLLGAGFGLATTYSAAWPVQLLCLACIYALSLSAPVRAWTAARTGWLFGLGWFCSSFWWLYISMHDYGFMPAWMAALAVVALSAFLALYPALAWVLFTKLRGNSNALSSAFTNALAFAALWMFNEWLRAQIFTGFPWNAIAYGHLDNPLVGFATVLGVDGVSFLAALLAALVGGGFYYILFTDYSYKLIYISASSIITIGVYGIGAYLNVVSWSVANVPINNPAHAGISVALLQGNVPQDMKFEPEGLKRGIELHLQMISEARADLIVTPETVIPVPDDRLPADLLLSLSDTLRSKESAALLGIVLTKPSGGYTNSALGFNLGTRGGEVIPTPKGAQRAPAQYRYDKYHLVPFGEFVPWGFRWFVDLMRIPLGDFARGPLNAPSFEVKGERIAPTICYEDVFGDELRARFTDEAKAPTMFANLTNLAWFGETFALDQHLAIARMRSVEFARPSVRATNTGATVVIDHTGKVTQALPRHKQGVLNAQVQGRSGLTPYARFGSGWFLWLCLAGLVVLGIQQRRAT